MLAAAAMTRTAGRWEPGGGPGKGPSPTPIPTPGGLLRGSIGVHVDNKDLVVAEQRAALAC